VNSAVNPIKQHHSSGSLKPEPLIPRDIAIQHVRDPSRFRHH
jgi:hypothetical protein